MPFLFCCNNARWGLGATKLILVPMDKIPKPLYTPPKVTSVAFRVEEGMQQSLTIRTEMMLDAFGNDTWDDPSRAASSSHFGDASWSGGSSFSSNSSFGSGTWDH